MKKVSLFWFNHNFYVVPYQYDFKSRKNSTPELLTAANEFLKTYPLEVEYKSQLAEDTAYKNPGYVSKITMENVREWVIDMFIGINSTELIGTTDPNIDLPTISHNTRQEYCDDDSFMLFPIMHGVENNCLVLEINENSGY